MTVYENQAESVLTQGQERIEELQGLWSVTDANNDIYAVNHSEGELVSVNEDIAELVSFELEMAEKMKRIKLFVKQFLNG